ncbi:RNA polymerase III subunit Rpc34 [Cerioporus squamosus]|nr:RNA polymerase III subunit Rpc34 [Cerioporus squamosus]
MSGRKLNALEQKLHQAALADPKHTLTQKQCAALISDASERTAALNFLLATGLLKAMKDASGGLTFRGVAKKELEVKKDMSEEEALILSYIQVAQSEGIWTKHLKAKTQLHQTVIDRCLKALTQKKLVKTATHHKYPTRRIYMLYHLQPSEEMTGGPWYTDNELDTEFIKLLCSACMRFVRDRSVPKRRGGDLPSTTQQLYPISASPQYPTAQQILAFLIQSRITETQLTVEHVESLLNVLVVDGEVERVPAFGAGTWDLSGESDAEHGASERTGKRRAADDPDSASRDRKRSKRPRPLDPASPTETHSEYKQEEGSRSSRHRAVNKEDDNNHKQRKRRRPNSDTESGLDSDTDGKHPRRSSSSTKRKRSSSPGGVDITASFLHEDYGACTYRAVRQEHVAGGVSQAPCVRCPTFDFCKAGGPVNPQECLYHGAWLAAAPG